AVARDVLPAGLRAAGWSVDVVEAYRTVTAEPEAAALKAAGDADAVCFTASSTVAGYLALGTPVPPLVVCIGPVTADAARWAGLDVTAVADPHTIDGLVDALIGAVRARPAAGGPPPG
ncbi:MAG: uroporphyrinogen-III synthase, partial [Acidimicrobiales bacterium]